MSLELYTAAGCLRCKVAKSFLAEKDRDFSEIDINEDDQAFAKFYRQNRGAIHRGPEGLEFPILYDGAQVVQGVGEILAWLQAGEALKGFISRSELLHGWIDGLDVSGGDPARARDFLMVLRHLHAGGIKIQLQTNGRNSDILAACQKEALADKVIMNLLGPAEVYADLGIPQKEVDESLRLLTGFSDYLVKTWVGPALRADGEVHTLSPEEVGRAAAWVVEATGERKHPYVLAASDPSGAEDERLKGLDPVPANALLKYRTAARRHLVKTEVEK